MMWSLTKTGVSQILWHLTEIGVDAEYLVGVLQKAKLLESLLSLSEKEIVQICIGELDRLWKNSMESDRN